MTSARLPAAAGRRRAARDAGFLRRARGPAHRLLGQLPQVHRQPPQGVVRRRGHAGQRLLLLSGCRGWTATTRNWPTSTAWRRARSRATSCSARTPAAAGPTPACTGPACATSTGWWSLDWFEIESAVFWKSDPNGPPPSEIKTEVFFIPAAAAPEKEGSSHQHPADAPVARQGHRPARRQPLRRLVPLPTSASASSSSTPARPTPGTSRCSTSPGTTTSTSGRACPTARSAGSRASRTSKRSSWRSTVTSRMRPTRRRGGPAW